MVRTSLVTELLFSCLCGHCVCMCMCRACVWYVHGMCVVCAYALCVRRMSVCVHVHVRVRVCVHVCVCY